MPDITPSKMYIHTLKELHREHEDEHITDEEFSQRIDELRKSEAVLHKSIGPVLIMQELEDIEKEVESEIKQEVQQKKLRLDAEERAKQVERTRQLQKQQREKQTEEQRLFQDQVKREDERYNFRNGIYDYIKYLENNTQKWQKWYSGLQIILLVFSAATATMASMDVVPRWAVSITGFIVAIAGGGLTTFKIQERIYAGRMAVTEVKLECQKYDYHIDEYKDIGVEEAFIKFSRSISLVQGQQMLQEVELWNPRKEASKEDKESDEIVEKLPRQEKLLEKVSDEQQNEDI